MSMKFRNPWIDPRILNLKPSEAEWYLANHGWRQIKPFTSRMVSFERRIDGSDSDGHVVHVPQHQDDIDYPQRMIDLVAALAFAEDRWAVEVLSEILEARNSPAANGASASSATGAAAS
jgi:hypothetical protein